MRQADERQQLLRLRRLGAWWDTHGSTGYRGQDRAFYVVSSLSDDDVDNNPADDYVIKDAQRELGSQPLVGHRLEARLHEGGRKHELRVAIDEAVRELAQHGRADVQDVIVFFTDGGANTTHDNGTHWSGNSPWFNRPCGSGVQAANNAKQISRHAGPPHRDLHDRLRPREPDLGVAAVPAAGANGHQNTSGSAQSEGGKTPQQALDRDGVGAGELLLHRRSRTISRCSSRASPATC